MSLIREILYLWGIVVTLTFYGCGFVFLWMVETLDRRFAFDYMGLSSYQVAAIWVSVMITFIPILFRVANKFEVTE